MMQRAQFCDQCGVANRLIARYCGNCGQELQPSMPLSKGYSVGQPQKTLNIAICYAHEDDALRERLVKQLSVLRRQGLIALWHDREISAGKEWTYELSTQINKAQIILLLISADFIASDYCYSIEMRQAIERHERGEARVIPIILRHVYWQGTPFGKLQTLPLDAQPIMASNWNTLDEAFFNVAEGIRKVVENFSNSVEKPTMQTDQVFEEKTLTVAEINRLIKRVPQLIRGESDLHSWKMPLTNNTYLGQQFGSYHLIRQLGTGGFSEVYLGERAGSDTQVAVKILQGLLMEDSIETFLSQAKQIALLIHPNIVRVFEVGVEKTIPFLVMDYAPNGTLRQRYPKGSQLPLSTIVLYINQIANALQYAHNRQFIHGDLKPENFLLGRNNEVLLGDFSFELDTSTDTDPMVAMAGTIPYMAPEQINGRRLRASDQYALGIIVYEWLCGNRPFSGSHSEVVTQHLVAPPPILRDKVKIPLRVESVVVKALAKSPERRFASVRDFAVALERASLDRH